MKNREEVRATRKRAVTIRFPQVDPARIVFYPRYFEMVYRQFPELPLEQPPFAIRTRFLKPNQLGDRLELWLIPGEGAHRWRVEGHMDDDVCFSMESSADAAAIAAECDAERSPAFETAPQTILGWIAGPNRQMQLSRYFEFVNIAIEEWFESTLEAHFHEVHVGQDVGIPTAQFMTWCRRLPDVGETVTVGLEPLRLGRKSMTFRSYLLAGEECLVVSEQVVVFVRMLASGYETIEMPDDIRARFAATMSGHGSD
jgi:acyl-CoA thioesterase FadM